MNSSIMTIIAWVYAVCGVIGSFIMGSKFEDLTRSSGAFITIVGILSTLFYAAILFAIAKILAHSEYCSEKLSAMERDMKRSNSNPPKDASNSKLNLSEVTSKYTGSEWRCPKCGKTNPLSSRTCKDCGYQK